MVVRKLRPLRTPWRPTSERSASTRAYRRNAVLVSAVHRRTGRKRVIMQDYKRGRHVAVYSGGGKPTRIRRGRYAPGPR